MFLVGVSLLGKIALFDLNCRTLPNIQKTAAKRFMGCIGLLKWSQIFVSGTVSVIFQIGKIVKLPGFLDFGYGRRYGAF